MQAAYQSRHTKRKTLGVYRIPQQRLDEVLRKENKKKKDIISRIEMCARYLNRQRYERKKLGTLTNDEGDAEDVW